MIILTIIQTGLIIIGAATVILKAIAPLTKNKTDDKILNFLTKFLEQVSLDSKAEKHILKIFIK